MCISRGTFCSTRNSENVETGKKLYGCVMGKFPENLERVEFRKANYSVENSRKPVRKSIGKEIFDKKLTENLEMVEFPKSKLFSLKFQKFREEIN